MKKYISITLRKFFSASNRNSIKEAISWMREKQDLTKFWQWEISKFKQDRDGQYNILYIGRKKHRKVAEILTQKEAQIAVNHLSEESFLQPISSGQTVLISEMPLPGTLCVPQYLRTVVPLGRPVEVIMADFDDKLRRTLMKQRQQYRLKQALSIAEIDYAERVMLRPFAQARHAESANQMDSTTVHKIAREFGRLDFVCLKDEIVGCMLGYESVRGGKRYWLADRCGYPENIFSNSKLLGETNSINHHLAMEWASENGFDYCDYALCFARPDDGLLQFKRNRGAVPKTIGLNGYGYFYVRLPRRNVAKYLWSSPMFSVEQKCLTLHLGVPGGVSLQDVVLRYRRMGFQGLKAVYLYCDNKPDDILIEKINSLYSLQDSPPRLKVNISRPE